MVQVLWEIHWVLREIHGSGVKVDTWSMCRGRCTVWMSREIHSSGAEGRYMVQLSREIHRSAVE